MAQVLGLGLVLELSLTGWPSSAMVDPSKIVGYWYHIFTASNELEAFHENNHMRLYSPHFDCSGHNCHVIVANFVYRYEGDCIFLTMGLEKAHGSLYQTIVPPGNTLEILNVGESMLLLGSGPQKSSGNTYAVLVLGRERTLSEADMEKFQKVLQEKGIGNQTVHFTNDDICRGGQKGSHPFTY